eukprot:jgi/Tetstr1/464176/TSEL_008981.t1
MGGILSSSGKIDESKTQARKLVAAFLVPARRRDTASGDRCHTMEIRIRGKTGTIVKPQWVLSRPYFASDSRSPDYGTLAGWHAALGAAAETGAGRAGMLHGPREACARWAHATSVQGADAPAYLHSMSRVFEPNSVTLTPTGAKLGGRRPPSVIPDMLWPTDRHVYDVPKNNFANAVEWNADYSPKDLPFAGFGRAVLQHGSVVLEPKESGAAFKTDKFKKIKGKKPYQIVSLATLVPPVPFVRAMQGAQAEAIEDTSGESRRQAVDRQKRFKRWVVLVGGAHAVGRQGDQASPWFADVAFETGRALADQWPVLRKEFRGIVTASGAGYCDSVTWDEEVSRGFCSVVKGEAPIFHVRDINQVALEGMCCDVPFGHGVILDSPAWKDDWAGNNRDLVLSLLAQDGLVIYGGLPSRGYRGAGAAGGLLMEQAVYRYSLLPLRPPLMSIVVAGASRGNESLTISGKNVTQFLSDLDVPSDALFKPLRTMMDRLTTFMDDGNRKANVERIKRSIPKSSDFVRYREDGRVEDVSEPDNTDVFWEPGEVREEEEQQPSNGYYGRSDYDDYGSDYRRRRSMFWGGGYMHGKEMAARLPVIYMVTTEGVKRNRTMLDESRTYRGFEPLDEQTHGSQATDETMRESVRIYASNMIADVTKRIEQRRAKAAANDPREDYNRYAQQRQGRFF